METYETALCFPEKKAVLVNFGTVKG